MVKLLLPRFLLFLFCVIAFTHLTAQTMAKVSNVADTRRVFLKMVAIEFDKDLKNAGTVQEKEAAKIRQLLAMKDSLKKAGEINDSLASDIGNRLLEKQKQVDSLNDVIMQLNRLISSLSAFGKDYTGISKKMQLLNTDIALQSARRLHLLSVIEKEMDIPDLGAERGAMKAVLSSADAQQKKEAAVITAIGSKKDDLLTTGEIDENTSKGLDKRFENYKQRMDSISNEIGILGKKLESPEEYRKNQPIIKAKIFLIDSLVNKNAKSREYSISMIEEALLKSKKTQFSLAAFFGPGGYIIPPEKYDLARKYFSPIVDSLIKFSNKYSSVERISNVTVRGYADASKIASGSNLFKKVAEYLKSPGATKEELNKGLSSLRAQELSRFLTMLIKEKAPKFKSIQTIIFESFEFGQGEKHPDPTITDYKVNDERRRIVEVFWSVLPNS
jgi:hypothetical protein